MKKFLLGTVGLVALGMAAPAVAADLAARPYNQAAPVMVAPMYDWSGFYIGVNGGWGQSSTRYDWAIISSFRSDICIWWDRWRPDWLQLAGWFLGVWSRSSG